MIRKSIFKASLFLGVVAVLFSCADSKIYKGDRYYDNIAYSDAIPFYEKVYDKNPTSEIGVKLADCYFKTGELTQAETVYRQIVKDTSVSSIQQFNYAKVLMANGKHSEAKVVLENYLQQHKNDASAQMLLTSCNSIHERYRDTVQYEMKPIQTDGFANAFSVSEYRDGIVFVGDKEVYSGRKTNPWTGDSYLDMYKMSKSEDGTWMSPELLKGDINGPFHEGPASFNAEGDVVYFTRSNYYKRKMNVSDEMENNLKIFKSTLVDGKWKHLEELPFNSDDYSVGHPALTPCCNTLYFVSDMPGGYGGTDLYRTDNVDGEWTKPENLGPEVNTSGNEMFPYYDEDGSLYFSSDAHNSMGGLDVFITSLSGDRWMTPENLNYPINSMKDDFGFIIDKTNNTGFISSSRSEDDKIYQFNRLGPRFNLYGFAHKKGTEIPVEGVLVKITDVKTGEVLTAISDVEGKFEMKLSQESDYDLLCTMEGCFSRLDILSTKGFKYSQDFYADFEVEEIVLDKPIVLENIYYDFDKWDIRPDAAKELDRLVKILKDNPKIEIEMGSHTDARGGDQYNAVLSGKRAYAAVQYLIFSGIDESRLTFNGYGESVLVNQCSNDVHCTDEEHQQNRRTEFKVTKINE